MEEKMSGIGAFESIKEQLAELSTLIMNSYSSLDDTASGSGRTAFGKSLDLLKEKLFQIVEQVTILEEERKKLESLSQTGRAINSTLDLGTILQMVMDTIIRMLGAERGFLMLKGTADELVMRLARNYERETLESSDAAVSRTVVRRVLSDGMPVLTTNAQEDPRFTAQESIIAYNLRSILCVPLKVKNEIIGVIYADNRTRSGIFKENDLGMMYAYCDQAAIAIENARLFESVCKTLAEVTELKDLMNNVFESIASGVLTIDKAHHVLLSNTAACTILGKSAQEIVGCNLGDGIPSISDKIAHHLQQVLESDRALTGLEINPELPGRGTLDLRINLSPLKDADHKTQGIAVVMDDLTEKRQLEAQRRLFERMVSPAVIRTIDPDALQLGGTRAVITSLFADIRGFTSFSEGLPPEELVSVLNRHLAAAAEAVLFEDGTIDKFLGDAVMAWFNAPLPQPDHTLRAVRAALAIRSDLQALHKTLPEKYRLSFGIGIHVGEAVLGLVGTEMRLDYTAIGDSVNTAKRIQENSAPGQILISQEALDNLFDAVIAEPVDKISLKGKQKPVQIYQVIRLR